MRTHVGEQLRRHRARHGMTLREVAVAAQVALGYVSELERGQKEASSEILAALCSALGVSVPDFLIDVSTSMSLTSSGDTDGWHSTAA